MPTDAPPLQFKAAVLRSYEIECYRICYALLGDEPRSLLAAETTLRELLHDPVFYRMDEPQQSKRMRKLAMRLAIGQLAASAKP